MSKGLSPGWGAHTSLEWRISPEGVSAEEHWKLYMGQGLEEHTTKEKQLKDVKDCH